MCLVGGQMQRLPVGFFALLLAACDLGSNLSHAAKDARRVEYTGLNGRRFTFAPLDAQRTGVDECFRTVATPDGPTPAFRFNGKAKVDVLGLKRSGAYCGLQNLLLPDLDTDQGLLVQQFQRIEVNADDVCKMLADSKVSATIVAPCYMSGWRICVDPRGQRRLKGQDTQFCGPTGDNGCAPCTLGSGERSIKTYQTPTP